MTGDGDDNDVVNDEDDDDDDRDHRHDYGIGDDDDHSGRGMHPVELRQHSKKCFSDSLTRTPRESARISEAEEQCAKFLMSFPGNR